MVGTASVFAQTRRKEKKGGGQFSYESSIGVDDDLDRGRGTEGGCVVHRNAAKYKHNAGPGRKRVRTVFETRTLPTCYHKIMIAFCTAEDVNIEEILCLCLS
jgi:hypothetical protein